MKLTKCPGVFSDGNAFFVLGTASRCLKRAGRAADAEEMSAAAMSGDYNHLIRVVMLYVDDAGDEDGE